MPSDEVRSLHSSRNRGWVSSDRCGSRPQLGFCYTPRQGEDFAKANSRVVRTIDFFKCLISLYLYDRNTYVLLPAFRNRPKVRFFGFYFLLISSLRYKNEIKNMIKDPHVLPHTTKNENCCLLAPDS